MDTVLLAWSIASALLLLLALYWIYTLEKHVKGMQERYQKILALADDADQATIVQILTRLADQKVHMQQIESQLQHVGSVLPHTIQGHGVVRYNAFTDVGGDQSFSLALVDEGGNGVMLSGLHGRGDIRVYAKPLVQWRSSYSLGAEEQAALGQARQVVQSGAPAESDAA